MALNAQEIINYIADSPKKTPVKIYVNLSAPVDFGSAEVFGEGKSRIVFGDWAELAPILCPQAQVGRGGLDDWISHFGLQVLQRHSASADALVTAELALILFSKARQQGWDNLLELETQIASRRRRQRAYSL